MIKVLLCRFEECLGSFTMLLVEASPEPGLFLHLSNHVMRIPYFRKYISYEGHLSFQNVQNFSWTSRMQKKNTEKVFCFLDKCFGIGCLKLSLLLVIGVSVLTNSPKILHFTNRGFFQLNFFHSDK